MYFVTQTDKKKQFVYLTETKKCTDLSDKKTIIFFVHN